MTNDSDPRGYRGQRQDLRVQGIILVYSLPPPPAI